MAFEDNIERAASPLVFLPSLIMQTAILRGAEIELESMIDWPESEDGEDPLLALHRIRLEDRRREIIGRGAQPVHEMLDTATRYLKVLYDYPRIRHGTYMSLVSVVLNAWTAFEVAATDLWVAAVNARPDTLGGNALRGNSGKSNWSNDLRTVITRLIEDGEGLPAGLLLKQAERFNFNRLDGIKAAYDTTFGSLGASVFEGYLYDDLLVMEGLRNVLIHRGGRADSQYLKRFRENREAFLRVRVPEVSIGAEIPIDGVIAVTMLGGAQNFAQRAFKMVDQWLVSHPS